ncbi:hypothetical protein F7725_021101, partial [Dissostichus mawsoni]
MQLYFTPLAFKKSQTLDIVKSQTAKLKELELQKTELEKQKTEVERLKQELQVQAAELITVKARSNVTENQVEALKRDGEGAYHFEFYIYGHGDPSHGAGLGCSRMESMFVLHMNVSRQVLSHLQMWSSAFHHGKGKLFFFSYMIAMLHKMQQFVIT